MVKTIYKCGDCGKEHTSYSNAEYCCGEYEECIICGLRYKKYNKHLANICCIEKEIETKIESLIDFRHSNSKTINAATSGEYLELYLCQDVIQACADITQNNDDTRKKYSDFINVQIDTGDTSKMITLSYAKMIELRDYINNMEELVNVSSEIIKLAIGNKPQIRMELEAENQKRVEEERTIKLEKLDF